jgi:2,4-dienoyl-CoA reductase-like NADH-dependent reductase (Old Yellow Enzyme family)
MSQLFTPIRLGNLDLPNRIAIAPMCQYSAEEGSATDWHVMHLGGLALSGAGLLIIEATAVTPEGRITATDLGLYSDANEDALGRVVRALRRHSPIKILDQLAHAGRKASCKVPWEGGGQVPPDAPGGWQTVAPSALPFASGQNPPQALDTAGLARIKAGFVQAARRTERLGLDGIEIHGAHGYLLHEFLSPLSNRRDDVYGGTLENRMRFPLEVFEAVRDTVAAEKPVGIRLSASDWVEGGWDLEQTIAFARALEARGCAFIHVSSGGLAVDQKIPVGPSYQVRFAQAVKAAVKIPVIAVGLITEPEQAETILQTGQADMIALARGILYDPRWPWHAAAKLGAQAWAPPQYLRSQPHGLKELFVSD